MMSMDELLPDGIFYSWKAVYQLIDDYQPKNEQGLIPLVEHAYAGHTAEWSVSGSMLTTGNSLRSNSYTIEPELDKETNDQVYVQINYGDNASYYNNDMRRIAGVRITAQKRDSGGNWIDILN